MDLSRITYVLRAIGLNGIVRTIRYSLSRKGIDGRFAHKSSDNENITPGILIRSSQIDSGIQLEFEHARAELRFLSPHMVRISWEPGIPPISYGIEKNDWDIQKPVLTTSSTGIVIKSGELCVQIKNQGEITYGTDEENIYKIDKPPVRIGTQWRYSALLMPEERIYGLGERAGHLNLRPGKYTSWNTDIGGRYSHGKDPLYIGTPAYLSLSNAGCHLVFFENSYRSTFNIDDHLESVFSGGMLRYYVILGSLDIIYQHFAELSGHPFLPPRWALGYHQSRWSYKSEAEVYKLISGFSEHNLPLSAIHLDIDYMDGFRLFTFDRKRFNNIMQLTKDLGEKGVKVIASVNPSVKRDANYRVYQDGVNKDVYCKLPSGQVFTGVLWPGWSVFPDFTNPSVRSWWQNQYHVLLDAGISGIWHDMNEPASFTAWGDKSFPPSLLHSMENRGGDHEEAHNIYGLLMDRAGYEALQKASPSKRPWILTRSGWAGVQRYAWNWTGDVETSWEALQQTIPTILGLNLSSHGFSGVDIGGFSGSPTAELYLRWFQMATFLPFFRTHSAVGTQPREPWAFGEPYTSIIRKFLELRYKLMPYLYTLSWSCFKTGLPPVRPLFWESPENKTLWEIEDEFLLGDALLVAPILNPSENIRKLILPPGKWYSLWDNKHFVGPTTIEIPSTNDTIPIFIKAGTILPMEESDVLTLHLYPADTISTSSILYSDRGDGFDQSRLDIFNIYPSDTGFEILWKKTGEYHFPYPNIKLQIHGQKFYKASIDGIDIFIQGDTLTIPIFDRMLLISQTTLV
jgi:alpha-glucosidase